MHIRGFVLLLALASSVQAQKNYEEFARRSQQRQKEYRERHSSIYRDVHRKWDQGEYKGNTARANAEIKKRLGGLKRWNSAERRKFRTDAKAEGIELVEDPDEALFLWNEIVDYRAALANARIDEGPDLERADPATLGDLLRDRDPQKVKAALATAQLRSLRLPPDDLALLLMRSREEAQAAQVARLLLMSDPRGGPAVLARHVMRERPAAAQIRELLGDDAASRVARARQIEPRRAALIQKAQAVTADDPEGLAALERLARVPGGDVGALLERLAGDKSQVVAERARAALAQRRVR